MVALISLIACSPFFAGIVLAARAHWNSRSEILDWRIFRWAEIASAWFLGMVFVGGGLSKLMPFPGVMGPVWLEQELTPYGLGMFARFIAWSEAIIGLCLLGKPTRVLGAIMMVPLLLNILAVVISMNWRGTPWVIMFFLAINTFLMAYHFPRWKPIVDVTMDSISFREDRAYWLTRVMSVGGILLILAGAIIYFLASPLSVAFIVIGFCFLVWGEFNSRFRTS